MKVDEYFKSLLLPGMILKMPSQLMPRASLHSSPRPGGTRLFCLHLGDPRVSHDARLCPPHGPRRRRHDGYEFNR